MRMRKKRHLERRLDSFLDKYLLHVEGTGFYHKPEEERFKLYNWGEVFGNQNPIEIEIGCGKGQFIIEMAKQRPDVNFVAVEKISNVVVSACEKAEREGIENVRFLNVDAYNLPYYFKAGVTEKIYLNFSTPYPKRTYAGKRLTHPKYLKIFRTLLCDGGEILQKTDDKTLFAFSLESLSQNGFVLKAVSLDLHASEYNEGNIVTEYEKSFSDKGLPIYFLKAVKTP